MPPISPLPGPDETPEKPAPSPAAPEKKGRKRIFAGKFLFVSIAIHLLFGAGATLWIVQTIQAKRKLTFQAAPPSSSHSTRAVEHKVQMAKKQQAMTAPAAKRILVNSPNAKVTLPDIPAMPSANVTTPAKIPGMTGAGFGSGAGAMGASGGAGGGSPINFFGLRTNAKRIAFLVDYSGSMSGAFRKEMEKSLEESLGKLPTGTQILIIPWAGPAWLYNQTAKQVADKWTKIGDEYDNFTLKPGVKLDPPTWVTIATGSAGNLMEGMKAQQSAPGGTDWRQPFVYAMQAQPPPDVIFFMTDGQIPEKTVPRAFAAIHAALHKTDKVPQVNCLWIENKDNKPDHLKKLAQDYKGEYLVLK